MLLPGMFVTPLSSVIPRLQCAAPPPLHAPVHRIVCAITYYGLVLLTTALQTVAKRDACTPSGAPNLDSSDYLAILIASTAEAPGLLAAASLIDRKGRKWTLRLGLLACTAALLGLLTDPSRGEQLAMLFAARAAVEGSYSVLYVYSPEASRWRWCSVEEFALLAVGAPGWPCCGSCPAV